MAKEINRDDALALEAQLLRPPRKFSNDSPPDNQIIRVTKGQRKRIGWKITRYFASLRYDDRYGKRFEDDPKKISQFCGDKIKRIIGRTNSEILQQLQEASGLPFLIVRNILPVQMGFANDEAEYEDRAGSRLEPATTAARRRMRKIDCVLGGLLSIVGTEPAPRFTRSC